MEIVAYTLTRAKRKTVSLQIRDDLTVVVRAPLRMPKAQIDTFVANHEGWIQKHLEQLRKRAEALRAFTYADGDRIPFRGGELVLGGGDRPVEMAGQRLLFADGTDRPAALAGFLREEARRLTEKWIACHAPAMSVEPNGVKITSARTRWGSCSGRNSLCFSYRLACLPDDLQEYIVVHELAHIREHNHSARFWAVVGGVLPDYNARRARLRAFHHQIPI